GSRLVATASSSASSACPTTVRATSNASCAASTRRSPPTSPGQQISQPRQHRLGEIAYGLAIAAREVRDRTRFEVDAELLAGVEHSRGIHLEPRYAGVEERIREAVGVARRDHGEDAGGAEGKCGGGSALAATELLARDEHVARLEARGKCRVEPSEEVTRGILRCQVPRHRRQDVGGTQAVGEAPRAPRQDGNTGSARA